AAGPAVRIANGATASAGDLIICSRNDHTSSGHPSWCSCQEPAAARRLCLCDALLEQLADPVMAGGAVRIAILGVGRVGSTVGRLWHAAGHDVTFAARDDARPRALAA